MEKKINNLTYIIENKILGKGAFGKVYLGTIKEKKEKIALKELPKEVENDKEALESISNEIQISSKLDNTNIVKMLEITEINNKQYLIYEFCNGGDLRKYMNYFKNFDEELIQIIVIKLINGLEELKKKKVVHHDIKPENILIQLFPEKEFTKDVEMHIESIKEFIKNKNKRSTINNNNQNFTAPNNFQNPLCPMYYNNNINNMNNMNYTNNMNYMNNFNYNINTMNQMFTYQINFINNINNQTDFQGINNANNNQAFVNNQNNMNNQNPSVNYDNQNYYNFSQTPGNIYPNFINNNNNNITNNYPSNNNNSNLNFTNQYNIGFNNNNNQINLNNNALQNNNNINNINNTQNNNINFNMNNINNNNNNQNYCNQNNINQNNNAQNNNAQNNNDQNNNNQNNNNQNNINQINEDEIIEALKNAQYKLSDFGLSKYRYDIKSRNLAGSPLYMSPELFNPSASIKTIENYQVDIWALGVLAFEMFFGRRPFEAFSIEELSKMYKKQTYYINLSNITISKPFFSFINMCLQKDPTKRADVKKLQNSSFVNLVLENENKMDEKELLELLGDRVKKDEKNNIYLSIDEIYFEEEQEDQKGQEEQKNNQK